MAERGKVCVKLICGEMLEYLLFSIHIDETSKGDPCLPSTDIMEIQNELEEAKNTLAQMQALHMEMKEKAKSDHVHDACKVTAGSREPQTKSFKAKSCKAQAKFCKTKSHIDGRRSVTAPQISPLHTSTPITTSPKVKWNMRYNLYLLRIKHSCQTHIILGLGQG